MSVQEKVFHSSALSGLKTIEPRNSKHGTPYIYAALNPIDSLLFLHHPKPQFGNYILEFGAADGSSYVRERVPGAFDHFYKGAKGSLYILPGDVFSQATEWEKEVVCPHPVAPLAEVKIDDSAAAIRKVAKRQNATIYLYPERPPCDPADDSDLIYTALATSFAFGIYFMHSFEEVRPDLFRTAREILFNPRSAQPFYAAWEKKFGAAAVESFAKNLTRQDSALLRHYQNKAAHRL